MSHIAPRARAILAALVLCAAAVPSAAQSKSTGPRRSPKRAAKTGRPASGWPSFESRHTEWARRKELAAEGGAAGPDALTQYLVGEVIVTGVFDTDTGYGVFLFATPTGTTFFVSAGAMLYNGRLTEIVPASSGFAEDTEVVFVERSGKVGAERRVVKRIERAPGAEENPQREE